MTNFSKLDAAIDWAIEEDAKAKRGEVSLWRQDHWAIKVPEVDCGTACCLAGNLVAAEGGKFVLYETRVWDDNDAIDDDFDWDDEEEEDDGYLAQVATVAVDREGREREIESWANEILGREQPAWLVGDIFAAHNTIDDIKRIRDDWAEAEGVPTRWR